MYYYIYDQFLSNKKYDKLLAHIEGKITDLGIKDRIIKMSILKSISELVTDALRKGADTIIVVGNDATINQVVNLLVEQDVVLGIIPVGEENNSIANFLGLHDPLKACETISARKIETINLGEINNNYFINCVKIFDNHLRIACNNKFTIIPEIDSNDKLVGVYNFLPEANLEDVHLKKTKSYFDPTDNFLEVVVEPAEKKGIKKFFKPNQENKKIDSIFRVKKIRITTSAEKPGSVLVDNFKVLKTPLDIKISDKQLKVIVGKDRKF